MLVAFGLLMLVDRLGGTDQAAHFAGHWWPVALALLIVGHGLTFVGRPFGSGTGRALPLTVLVVALAVTAVILLGTTGHLPSWPRRYVGPGALLCAGTALAVTQPVTDRRYQTWVRVDAVLRRRRLVSRARGIRQVSVLAVLGQAAVDLTSATLAGDAELHATVLGGVVVLRLPAGWKVDEGPVAGHDLRVDVPPVPPGMPTGPQRTLPVHLLGARGKVVVEWSPDATPAPPPGPAPAGGPPASGGP